MIKDLACGHLKNSYRVSRTEEGEDCTQEIDSKDLSLFCRARLVSTAVIVACLLYYSMFLYFCTMCFKNN